jgi:hypothetical protein
MKNLHVSACGKINILFSLCIMSSFTTMSDYTYARRIQDQLMLNSITSFSSFFIFFFALYVSYEANTKHISAFKINFFYFSLLVLCDILNFHSILMHPLFVPVLPLCILVSFHEFVILFL